MSRILSQSFVWIGSATHSTSDAFRQRQRERIRRMQNNDAGGVESRHAAQKVEASPDCAPKSRRARYEMEPGAGVDSADSASHGNRRLAPGPASPFKDSRADMDARGERLREQAETVADIYRRAAFARKEGK